MNDKELVKKICELVQNALAISAHTSSPKSKADIYIATVNRIVDTCQEYIDQQDKEQSPIGQKE